MKILVILLFLASSLVALEVTGLRTEHRTNPVGIDDRHIRLTWRLECPERGTAQSAYEIIAASAEDILTPDEADLWKSGKKPGRRNWTFFGGDYGKQLKPGQQVFWKVRAWDRDDEASAWSEPATWTCGLTMGEQPVAPWISFDDKAPFHTDGAKLHLPPPRYYRKTFETKKTIKRAIAFASALGIYELHCNGGKVGDAFFAPGWTDYRKRAYYNTYDLTDQLRQGTNTIGAVVADGWYAGYLGGGQHLSSGPHQTGRNFYGKTPALMVQLQIEYDNGDLDTIMTDASWRVSTGPEFEADLLMGEGFDARRKVPGWSTGAFDASGWPKAVLAADNGLHQHPFIDRFVKEVREFGFVKPPVMQAYPAQPVRISQELPARKVASPEPGIHIFDLGQTIAGTIRLRTEGEAGQKITIRYGGRLHPADGRLMAAPSRAATSTDTYICSGDPAGEVWMPRFTWHHFRFIEVSGLAGTPDLETVTGLVLHSDTPFISGFACSDPLVNRIYHNAIWAQRGSSIDLPTRGARRDERLGWCGDAQVYAGAAACHADTAAFYKKWLRELEDAITPEGYYPSYAPYPFGHGEAVHGTAWSDAGIICPYALWRATGDHRFYFTHRPAMKRYMEARWKNDPELKGSAFGAPWGDRLHVDDPTPHEFLDLCYMAQNCRLMSVMGEWEDIATYREWRQILKKNFLTNHLKPDGRIEPSSQTAHVLALAFGLIPEKLRAATAGHLAEMIRSKAGPDASGMTTGMLGTRSLLPVLSSTGHHDLAVRLLQSRRPPSWGHEVENGPLNAFSRCATGAVTEWMMSTLAGIQAGAPGYDHIRIVPQIPSPDDTNEAETISWVKAHHDCPHGRIAVHWKRVAHGLDLAVTIPPNTTATVIVPGAGKNLTESGGPVAQADGVMSARFPGTEAVVEVRAGSYLFQVR